MAIAPYGNAYEKLLGAMEIMATGKGTHPERLMHAGRQSLLPFRHLKTHTQLNDRAASLDSLFLAIIELRRQAAAKLDYEKETC